MQPKEHTEKREATSIKLSTTQTSLNPNSKRKQYRQRLDIYQDSQQIFMPKETAETWLVRLKIDQNNPISNKKLKSFTADWERNRWVVPVGRRWLRPRPLPPRVPD
jgi:4-alpha-glucanotransferase